MDEAPINENVPLCKLKIILSVQVTDDGLLYGPDSALGKRKHPESVLRASPPQPLAQSAKPEGSWFIRLYRTRFLGHTFALRGVT